MMTRRADFSWPVKAIVKVVDGDSLRLSLDRGFRDYSERDVRVFGVDAPERFTDAGKAVRSFVTAWTSRWGTRADTSLFVDSYGLDKYGRVLGDVLLRFGRAGGDGLEVRLTDDLLGLHLARPYSGGRKEPWPQDELDRIAEDATRWRKVLLET